MCSGSPAPRTAPSAAIQEGKRRLDIATALLGEPEVLFLDEPTTGLDPQSRRALWDQIRRLKNRGVTVFLTPTSDAPAWFDMIATINPFTQVLDGTRYVLAGRTEATNLVVGLGAFLILGIAADSLAARAYAGVISPD